MSKDTLQSLIDMHNILFKIPVQGESVIPMAQVLATLQNTIQEMSTELINNNNAEFGGEG